MNSEQLRKQVNTIRKSMSLLVQALQEVEDQLEHIEDKEMEDYTEQCKADESEAQEKSDQLAG